VPLVHAEVGVEVVGQREPRDHLPAHPRFPTLDVGLRGARDEREGRVAGVQVGDVGDLIGEKEAAAAATLGFEPQTPSLRVTAKEGSQSSPVPPGRTNKPRPRTTKDSEEPGNA
jgi:hypothetical protein